MSSDLTFVTNEAGSTRRDRLAALLAHTRQSDVLVGLKSHLETSGAVPLMILDELDRRGDTPGRAITARS